MTYILEIHIHIALTRQHKNSTCQSYYIWNCSTLQYLCITVKADMNTWNRRARLLDWLLLPESPGIGFVQHSTHPRLVLQDVQLRSAPSPLFQTLTMLRLNLTWHTCNYVHECPKTNWHFKAWPTHTYTLYIARTDELHANALAELFHSWEQDQMWLTYYTNTGKLPYHFLFSPQ